MGTKGGVFLGFREFQSGFRQWNSWDNMRNSHCIRGHIILFPSSTSKRGEPNETKQLAAADRLVDEDILGNI